MRNRLAGFLQRRVKNETGMNPVSEKGFLVLQNGMVFEGRRFGAPGEVTAEICFTTGMTGYLETLTDPSYHGQIVVQTFPMIGNYGVIPDDFESAGPRLSAYVVREVCAEPSNFRSRGGLDGFLRECGVAGLEGVDTRTLARTIRERGVMNAAILDEPPADVGAFARSLAAKALSSDVFAVTCGKPFIVNPDGKIHIALWDFGFKSGIARALAERGCKVSVLPAGTGAEQIQSLRPDGVLLSNGPGDPAAYTEIIANVKKILESGLPVFGICLGHQLLGIASGAKTVKLKYGHRGGNQPVREISTGRLLITSQNHGYAVDSATLTAAARLSWENVNDGTCEGLDFPGRNAFSVQFHPEACAGPQDCSFLFDRFLNNCREASRHAAR